MVYRLEHDACPTPEQLVASGLVRRNSSIRDRWESPFRVECSEPGDIVVISAGPDRAFGTHDDLSTRAPKDWPLE